MVRNSKEAIPQLILPLANWFIELKRLDLYNKSRVMGDYQARFCERIRVKLPFPTRLQYGTADKYFWLGDEHYSNTFFSSFIFWIASFSSALYNGLSPW